MRIFDEWWGYDAVWKDSYDKLEMCIYLDVLNCSIARMQTAF